jgi:hypothetical protein
MMSDGENQLGPYRLAKRLGNGGMGEVWEAAHRDRPGAPVALKMIKGAPGSPAIVQALREGRIGLGLCHPNIVRTFDVGFSKGRAYIVLELLRGATVAELCPLPGAPLPYPAAAAVALHALAGLQYAHGAKGEDGRPLHLVHNDVKSSNLFVTPTGAIKLLDFGIASVRAEGGAGSPEHRPAGTVAYMAPERIEGAPADPRSDLYALAVVVAELLSGDGRTAAPLGPLPAGVPAELHRWLRVALDPDPRQRFASAGEMAAALRACVAEPWSASALAAWYAARPRPGGRATPAATRWLDRDPAAAAVVASSAPMAAQTFREAIDPGEIFFTERTLRTPLRARAAVVVRPGDGTAGTQPALSTSPDPREAAAREPTTHPSPLDGGRRRWMAWGSAALGVLVLAGLTGAGWATQRQARQDDGPRIAIRENERGRAATRRPHGWISVDAAVPQSRIRVAGTDVGKAPLVRYRLSPGVHLVEAVLPDGRRLARRVRVEAGRGEQVSFR